MIRCVLPKHLLLRKKGDSRANSSCKVTSKSRNGSKRTEVETQGAPTISFCQVTFLFVVFIQIYVSDLVNEKNYSNQRSNLSSVHFI